MSNGSKGPQLNSSVQTHEALDLTKLHANESLRNVTSSDPSHSPAHDLTQVSINSVDVTRLTRRPEKRHDLTRLASTLRAQELSRKDAKDSRKNNGRTSIRNGILKNPYYRYEGGPLGRLIAFLANLLKALEQALLRTVEPPPRSPPPTTMKKRKNLLDLSEEQEREESEKASSTETSEGLHMVTSRN